jgi:hypothetical protein
MCGDFFSRMIGLHKNRPGKFARKLETRAAISPILSPKSAMETQKIPAKSPKTVENAPKTAEYAPKTVENAPEIPENCPVVMAFYYAWYATPEFDGRGGVPPPGIRGPLGCLVHCFFFFFFFFRRFLGLFGVFFATLVPFYGIFGNF